MLTGELTQYQGDSDGQDRTPNVEQPLAARPRHGRRTRSIHRNAVSRALSMRTSRSAWDQFVHATPAPTSVSSVLASHAIGRPLPSEAVQSHPVLRGASPSLRENPDA